MIFYVKNALINGPLTFQRRSQASVHGCVYFCASPDLDQPAYTPEVTTPVVGKTSSSYCLSIYRPVVLNLGSIEPQGFGESISRVRRRSHTHTLVITYVQYLCFEEIIFFLNYEGFGECTDEPCRVQYLQQG